MCSGGLLWPIMRLNSQHATSILGHTRAFGLHHSFLEGSFSYILIVMQQYLAFTALFRSHGDHRR